LTINGISFSDNGGYVGRDYAYAVSHSGLTQQATQETGTSGSGILGYAFSGGVD